MIDYQAYISFLQKLIQTPSFSREEDKTADLIADFLEKNGILIKRQGNNVWANNRYFSPEKPTILLNSHHDTVKVAAGWQQDPFGAFVDDTGKLYGLGSNDAGASLVSLMATFLYFYEAKDLNFNLIYAATAEEEISGANGIASILSVLDAPPSVGIVGEPTQMQMAVAEKGLMVLDATAFGKAGHAARNEGINAISIALRDIEAIHSHDFEQKSPLLGSVKATVTQINAGTQHNVVPAECHFVIDVRSNECYTNAEIYEILQNIVQSSLKPRSFRLNSSRIDLTHPLVLRGGALGLSYYGSPTLSDAALMPFQTLKIGPGDSARSHTADEFIFVEEIKKGIDTYIALLRNLKLD